MKPFLACSPVSRIVLLYLITASFMTVNPVQSAPREDRCVILISVDGLANFYLDDPKTHVPTIRRLASRGTRAAGMVCSFPTVTWPNHTSMVTGVSPARHGVIGNNYLDRASGEKVALIPDPVFDKDQLVRSPTIYDVAHRHGLVTAGIIWPATRNARTLDWTVPDMFGNDSWQKFGTPQWLEELRSEGIPVDDYGRWVKESTGGVQRDWLYARMADHLFRQHPPNLLLIHLVEVDHVEHRSGPRTTDAYWSVSYADSIIRDIIESAGRSRFGQNVSVIVTSDHGFFPISKDICPNVLFRQSDLVNVTAGKVTDRKAWCVAQGGAAMIYILDKEHRDELTKKLKADLGGLEGIARVMTRTDFTKLGQPTPETDQRAPDLWLSARSGYSFSESFEGDDPVRTRTKAGGTHGYLPDQPDMLGTLILSGAGIRSNARISKASILDIAPTIAHLLDIPFNDSEGRVLKSALTD